MPVTHSRGVCIQNCGRGAACFNVEAKCSQNTVYPVVLRVLCQAQAPLGFGTDGPQLRTKGQVSQNNYLLNFIFADNELLGCVLCVIKEKHCEMF